MLITFNKAILGLIKALLLVIRHLQETGLEVVECLSFSIWCLSTLILLHKGKLY